VAARIGGSDVTAVIRANTPFLLSLVVFLLLLVFFPALSTTLPGLMR
jgi:TRAP-type C4-dicarboxylate transport system permease large subunit